MSEATDAIWTAERDASLATLRKAVEALSENPAMWSRSAYTTPRRTPHVIFGNGIRLRDGETAPTHIGDLETLAHLQLTAIREYRDTISGPVDLCWRVEPEARVVEGRFILYTRLCFEPSLSHVADGVWVESRRV